jgi:hypothetical protein
VKVSDKVRLGGQAGYGSGPDCSNYWPRFIDGRIFSGAPFLSEQGNSYVGIVE